MVQITFESPEHGWLPVAFQSDDFKLQIDASDVPVNPLDGLCNALIIVLEGRVARMGWHLEPAWNYFQFEPRGNIINLRILTSPSFRCETTEIFRTSGTFETLLLPFYKALKKFDSAHYGDNWPTMNQAKLIKLNELVKARKLP